MRRAGSYRRGKLNVAFVTFRAGKSRHVCNGQGDDEPEGEDADPGDDGHDVPQTTARRPGESDLAQCGSFEVPL
jgi:hypothetical protein